jgi:tRNA (cmo5U34)-methyltransferase
VAAVVTEAPVDPPVNRWAEAAWAQRYLSERDAIPHRVEGLAVLLELLPTAPARVLDLGTGDGNTLAMVLDARPGATGVGVDFSAEMLGRARERFADEPRIEIVEHDLDAPLPDAWGSFDLVVSSFAIHHCIDRRKRALYGEVFDKLTPGGTFLNLEHVASPTPELHAAFLTAIGKTAATDDPSNKLALVETQLEWLRAFGFDQVECYWKWRELALFGGDKGVTPRS